MNNDTLLSPRNLKKERTLAHSLFAVAFLLLLLFTFLWLFIPNLAMELGMFLLGGAVFVFILGYYALKETNFSYDVYLSNDFLQIDIIYNDSKTNNQRFDWASISNLSLIEKRSGRRATDYKLKLALISKYTGTIEDRGFLLHKYSRDPEQQRQLFKLIYSYWVDSQNEHKNLVTPDTGPSYSCQLCFESYLYSDLHYICEKCSRRLCKSCYHTCKSVNKTTCPNCNGSLTLSPSLI